MRTVELAGLKITATTKQEFLKGALERIASGNKTFVITPYSEFLHATFSRPSLLNVFNKADFSLADGIGMLWAAAFLSLPLRARSYFGKIAEALWQAFYTLAAIILCPGYVRKVLPEKIVGANLIWDLAGLAAKSNLSVYLLGGFGNTAELAAEKLINKNPELNIAGISNKDPDDPTVMEDINRARPDILFVAYGPIRQEEWIAENLLALDIKLAIGLGGTFDYLAGKYKNPPAIIRSSGLEWLWRLVTQPRRWRRIYNATFGLVNGLVRYKVFDSLPMRPNVAAVILNQGNKILVCEREPSNFHDTVGDRVVLEDGYWQLPQGGVEPGEDIIEAARREAIEETGLKDIHFIKLSSRKYEYTWNLALRRFVSNRVYRHRGQSQQVVFFRFNGPDNEVRVDEKEFIAYRWVDPKNLADIVHPERLGLTSLVLEELEKILKT